MFFRMSKIVVIICNSKILIMFHMQLCTYDLMIDIVNRHYYNIVSVTKFHIMVCYLP